MLLPVLQHFLILCVVPKKAVDLRFKLRLRDLGLSVYLSVYLSIYLSSIYLTPCLPIPFKFYSIKVLTVHDTLNVERAIHTSYFTVNSLHNPLNGMAYCYFSLSCSISFLRIHS
jgi:hypothetical protein